MSDQLKFFRKQVETGSTLMTPGVEAQFPLYFVFQCIRLHQSGNWGDLDEHDKQVNEQALIHGDRIMSVYTLNSRTLWIITDTHWHIEDRTQFDTPDGSPHPVITTVLLPEEY